MRSQIRQAAPIFITACAFCCLLGCGKEKLDRGTISGQVSFEGKPLEVGEIVFIPRDGTKGPSAKGPIAAGRYSLDADGPVVGKHRVEIYAFRATGKKIPDMSAKARTNPESIEEKLMYIPALYNDESTLTQDIQPGPNSRDFDLKGPARR